MTERELRKLSRTDLLELLLAQRRENEQLRCLLDQAEAQLADRTIKIDKAGTLAEASLQLSGIFEAAEISCKYYLDNIRQVSERQALLCQQLEAETKERCDRMIAEAELKARQQLNDANLRIQKQIDSYTGLQKAMLSLAYEQDLFSP